MRRRDQRLIVVIAVVVMLGAAAGLFLYASRNLVAYFVSPSELAERAEPGQRLRLGGLVEPGSVRREAGGLVRFTVTDGTHTVEVEFNKALPDLFAEGQGVVAEGTWRPGEVFRADRLLAKHDETYMPREVTEALKQRGEWKGDAEQ